MTRLLRWVGDFSLFTIRFFRSALSRPFEGAETMRQMDEIGAQSLPLAGVAGLAIGAVLAMQTRSTLARFGGESLLPSMVALAVVKEIGPIMTAVVVAGRVGAGIGAELGSMRVTEQIDAMEVSAVNPFKLLVVTRVLACSLVMPILTIYTDFLAICGAFLASILERDISIRLFISDTVRYLGFDDVIPSLLKTVVFGFLVGIVGSFQGFNTRGGTAGVGRSATSAVVLASLLVIFADVILVKITLLVVGR